MIVLATGPSPLWYLARGSGAVALVLLTVSVALGITGVVRLRARSPKVPRFLVDGLHRNVSLLVLVFIVGHILMSVLDPFAHIHYLDAVVPFVSSYRPIWLGMGAVAFDLLIALVVTSLLRMRLGLKTWRAIHWAAYACWPLAVTHGVATGSDARVGWFQLLTATCVASVVVAIAVRLNRARSGQPLPALAGAGALVAVTAAVVFFAAQGPMRPGWAARAGTPTKLLASVQPRATGSGSSPVALRLPMSGRLRGTIHRTTQSDGTGREEIRAAVNSGSRAAVVAVDLVGLPLQSGGLRVTGGTASLGSRSVPTLYTGTRVSVNGSDVVALLRPARGPAVRLRLALSVPSGSGRLSGTARAAAA